MEFLLEKAATNFVQKSRWVGKQLNKALGKGSKAPITRGHASKVLQMGRQSRDELNWYRNVLSNSKVDVDGPGRRLWESNVRNTDAQLGQINSKLKQLYSGVSKGTIKTQKGKAPKFPTPEESRKSFVNTLTGAGVIGTGAYLVNQDNKPRKTSYMGGY